MKTSMNRREAMRNVAVGALAVGMGGTLANCASTTNATTGVVTYGIDPAVIAAVQSAVTFVAQYTPAVESIAATAAGLFGPGYAAIVTAGSALVGQLETALENLVANLPAGTRLFRSKRMGAAATAGAFKGYVKTPNGYVSVFAQ